MKKFRLKPLGDLRQKLNMNWFFIGLIMALCVSACSNDDNNSVAPTFPEKQTVDCTAGDTKELTFEANANWQLSSSATWCRFVVNGNEEYSLSGKAGKQTVSLKITDEALRADAKTVAQITLMIGTEKAIIADVARNAKGLELKIYDMDGNEIKQIEVGYNDYKPFVVKANFRFAATNRSEWADIEGGAIVGISNKEVTGKIQIVDEAKFYKYIQEGTITFSDERGLASYTFPLVFNGMDRTKIKITRPTQNPWDWTVSLDGKTFSQEGSSSASSSTSMASYKNGLTFNVDAFEDKFTIVYLEDYNGQFYDDANSWIHVNQDKSNVRVTVDPTTNERIGYVLAFSDKEYEEIKDRLIPNLIVDGVLAYKYEQQNLLMQFTQKDKKTTDNVNFKIISAHSSSYGQEIEYQKYTEGDADYFKNKYKVQSIYEIIDPTVSIDIQYTTEIASYDCRNFDNNEDKDQTGICQRVENKINAYIDGLNKDIFIVIIDEKNNGDMFIIRYTN